MYRRMKEKNSFDRRLYGLIDRYCSLSGLRNETDYSLYNDFYHIRMYRYEKIIFSSFRLPMKAVYHKNLTRLAEGNDPDKAGKIIHYFTREAYRYYHSQNETLQQILLHAVTNRRDPFDVLPELNICVNGYTIFLYNEIAMKNGKCFPSVIKEFTILRQRDFLSDIDLLCLDPFFRKNSLYYSLVKSGLRYLNAFLNYYHFGKKMAM